MDDGRIERDIFTPQEFFRCLSMLLFILIIGYVYLRPVFQITPGSPKALLKDALIVLLLLFFVCTLLFQYKRIIGNRVDRVFIAFMLFCLFEVLWTYFHSGSLHIGIFRYRLYFFIYLLYFPFIYFGRKNPTVIYELLKYLKVIFVISFLWGITEFFMINAKIVSIYSIANYLNKGSTGNLASFYGTIPRGFGPLGHVILSGCFYVVGLSVFLPVMLRRKDINAKLYFLLGVAAIICSLGKTAWVLLAFVFVMLFIGNKERKFSSFILASLFLYFLYYAYNNSLILKGSVDASVFHHLPIYYTEVSDFFRSSLSEIIFGYGYEVSTGDISTFGLEVKNESSISIGTEIFFVSLLRQLGLMGMFLYALLFFIVPARIYFKDNDLLVKGICLAIMAAGLSSMHNNMIFRNGLDIITCFLLASLSILHYHSDGKVTTSTCINKSTLPSG